LKQIKKKTGIIVHKYITEVDPQKVESPASNFGVAPKVVPNKTKISTKSQLCLKEGA